MTQKRSTRSLFGIPPTAELAEIRLFYYSRKIETRQKHKFWYPEKRLYRGVPLGSGVWKRILLRKCLVWGFQLPLPNGTPLYLQKCLFIPCRIQGDSSDTPHAVLNLVLECTPTVDLLCTKYLDLNFHRLPTRKIRVNLVGRRCKFLA